MLPNPKYKGMNGRFPHLHGISVVVLTHGREDLAGKLFESLASETASSDVPAEVVVIDDSREPAGRAIADLCQKFGCLYHFHRGSVSTKRNYGVALSRFPLVLFLDSDCQVMAGLLSEHSRSYSEPDIGGVLGVTEFTGSKNWVWRAIEKTSFTVGFSFARLMACAPWGPCTNISFRKDVLLSSGGFRTDFPFDYSGEDVEIGLRTNQSGYRIKCNSKALALHTRQTWSRFLPFCGKIFRWGRTDFHILKNYRHLAQVEFPRVTVLTMLLLLVSLGISVAQNTLAPMLLPVSWVVLVSLTEAALKTCAAGRAGDFPALFLAFWFSAIFEAGAVSESLKHGSLLMLNTKIVYGQGQLIHEWSGKVIEAWSLVISALLLLFVALL